MRQETIKYAHGLIKEKLSSILECRSLVELAAEFETRIYQYYKPVFKQNREASRSASLNLLESIMSQTVTRIHIKESEDISPHLFGQMKAEYCSALQ